MSSSPTADEKVQVTPRRQATIKAYNQNRGSNVTPEKALRYGVLIQSEDPITLCCLFCLYFGKESKDDSPRRPVEKGKTWSGKARTDHIVQHHKLVHPTAYAEFLKIRDEKDGPAAFFEKNGKSWEPPLAPLPPLTVAKMEPQGLGADEEGTKGDGSLLGLVSYSPAKSSGSKAGNRSLRQEVTMLRKEKLSLQLKLDQAEKKNDTRIREIMELQESLEEVKQSSAREQEGVAEVSKQLEKTKALLKGFMDELKGLRITMVDMMEQYDFLKERSQMMNDGLKSIYLSLETLMLQQKDLGKDLNPSSEESKASPRKRKEPMTAVKDEIEDRKDDENENCEPESKKPAMEMEALAALIEAARD